MGVWYVASLSTVYLVLLCLIEREHVVYLIERYEQVLVAVESAVVLALCDPSHHFPEALLVRAEDAHLHGLDHCSSAAN